jgi:DNA polymerase III epsilon subunit-like protein
MRAACFFDVETAGLADTAPIIQLAAVAVDEDTWEELGSFNALLQFDAKKAEPEALKLNHYDRERWAEEAIPPAQAVQKFSRFLDGYKCLQFISKRTGQPYSVAKLVGHNAATFDGPRLKRLYGTAFLPADPRVRDTLQAALWWFDARGIVPPAGFSLGALCKYFGIPTPDGSAHDALVDVQLTVQLARKLRETAAKAEEVANVSAA